MVRGKEIYKLRSSGFSWTKIANEFNTSTFQCHKAYNVFKKYVDNNLVKSPVKK